MTSQQLGGPTVYLSVVIPCFNEFECLDALYERVSATCRAAVESNYEILLINDGSKDRTWEKIAAYADKDPAIVGVNLSRNYGHQLALTAGLNLCRGERVLILDADLQDPPELLGEMMAKMDAGFDVVYGQREERQGETLFKRGTAALFYRFLSRLVDIDIPQDTGDFRLMSRKALDHLNAMPEHYRFVRGLVSWLGFRQTSVRYSRAERFAGTTNYPLSKMIRLAFDAITAFSISPLRIASHVGIILGLLFMLFLGGVLYSWANGDVVPGWTSIVTIVLLVGSIQLITLGIMGEYVGRTYMESKRRPLFIVDEVRKLSASSMTSSPVHSLQARIGISNYDRG
ncbi:glycosyltransferase family 2 protein [Sphingosinicella xenopeptidilytica]|uniref:Glycosyltransferase family 2 protein n=1 Tax=Sphingosinicella xenopeptidilytica TaxID=364098 RepID=A0ABW3CA01_SPHXN